MSMIILASGSPRRKEILETIGLTFEIIPAQGEEVITSSVPEEVVQELSEQKAIEVATNIYQYSQTSLERLFEPDESQAVPKLVTDTMVIGADTVVSVDGKILGKPKDEAEAFQMLKSLSGRAHKVYTGVTVIIMAPDGRSGKISFAEETKVFVAQMSDEEINRYIATGDPMDKAGSYGIQGAFGAYIKGIEGDYQNVVGFPVARFYAELKKVGIDILEW